MARKCPVGHQARLAVAHQARLGWGLGSGLRSASLRLSAGFRLDFGLIWLDFGFGFGLILDFRLILA